MVLLSEPTSWWLLRTHPGRGSNGVFSSVLFLLLEHFKKEEEGVYSSLPATKEVKGAKARSDVRQGTRALAQTQAVHIDALL